MEMRSRRGQRDYLGGGEAVCVFERKWKRTGRSLRRRASVGGLE